ncbi:unnamed protein product [Macrosiphum euphorbiae]|uniref:Reverse transcriptase domain-containing protein n=1 Tax=Macrosiphum euphorbiae TaxID=13131 RepID=A0AAV0VI19_9HEMI|nr:unnamed protein product [Macrosiphum euphorbiae]
MAPMVSQLSYFSNVVSPCSSHYISCSGSVWMKVFFHQCGKFALSFLFSSPLIRLLLPTIVPSLYHPHIVKIFECIIFNYLGSKLNRILILQQHGFRIGRSTISCTFSYFIYDCLCSGAQIDIIFTDFSKAFDTVPHNLLINELDRIGIGDSLLSLFRSYLSNRKQFVKLNEVSSGLSDVTSGVPQGGHLSP